MTVGRESATANDSKVAIIGMGLSKWGERWDAGTFDLVSEACNEAFTDAGIDKKQVDACWTGYYQNETATTGVVIAQTLQLQQIPITRVENGCASGAEVIRGAALGLASKQYDLVLAVGFEKLKDVGFGGMATAPGLASGMVVAPVVHRDHPIEHIFITQEPEQTRNVTH